MGVGSALHVANKLDLAAGTAGADVALPAARALYAQLLEVAARDAKSEARVRRRFWLHAKLAADVALRTEQQAALVAALRAAGRWEESCAVCLDPLDPVGEDLEVVECMHCFHVGCTRELARRSTDVRAAPVGVPDGYGPEVAFDCPLCRRSLRSFFPSNNGNLPVQL